MDTNDEVMQQEIDYLDDAIQELQQRYDELQRVNKELRDYIDHLEGNVK